MSDDHCYECTGYGDDRRYDEELYDFVISSIDL